MVNRNDSPVSNTDPDGAVPRRPSQVGRVVAEKYELMKLLGEGGMGAVYEARHLLIGRRVALKFVHTELAWRSDIMSRFSREARAAGSLEGENIAAVTDFGTDADGTPFLVMEYLVGVDLGHMLSTEGPLPIARACQLLVQACRGLSLAHDKGIVHRDLKPDNLFVTQRADGTDLLKILDFGIAKLTQQDGSSSTKTGSAIGTPFYMSPEQVRASRALDHRTDVYSLGVILYELLSNQKPHTGESYTDVLLHVISAQPIPLATHRAELPAALVAVVDKAMAFEADARFQSAEELANALGPFVGAQQQYRTIVLAPAGVRNTDPGADTPPRTPDAGVPAGTLLPFTDGGTDAPPPAASAPNRAPLFAGAVALVAAIAVGGFMLSRTSGDTATAARAPTSVAAPTASAPVVPAVAPVVPVADTAPTVSPATEPAPAASDAPKKGPKPAAPSKPPPPAAAPKKAAPDLYAP